MVAATTTTAATFGTTTPRVAPVVIAPTVAANEMFDDNAASTTTVTFAVPPLTAEADSVFDLFPHDIETDRFFVFALPAAATTESSFVVASSPHRQIANLNVILLGSATVLPFGFLSPLQHLTMTSTTTATETILSTIRSTYEVQVICFASVRGTEILLLGCRDGKIRLMTTTSGGGFRPYFGCGGDFCDRDPSHIPIDPNSTYYGISGMATAPTARHIVLIQTNNTFFVWNLESWNQVYQFTDFRGLVSLSPNGVYAATYSAEYQFRNTRPPSDGGDEHGGDEPPPPLAAVHIVHLQTGSCVSEIEIPTTELIIDIKWSPDGERIAVVDGNGKVFLSSPSSPRAAVAVGLPYYANSGLEWIASDIVAMFTDRTTLFALRLRPCGGDWEFLSDNLRKVRPGLVVSPDGKFAVVRTTEREYAIVSTVSWVVVENSTMTFETTAGCVSFAWSLNGSKVLAVCDDGSGGNTFWRMVKLSS
jgi:WD40 repeat protein